MGPTRHPHPSLTAPSNDSRRNRSGGTHWPEKVVPILTETDKKGQDGYQTRPQATAALAWKLAEANPERTFWLVGDSAYVNAAVLQN